jgi:hypothetical protein
MLRKTWIIRGMERRELTMGFAYNGKFLTSFSAFVAASLDSNDTNA